DDGDDCAGDGGGRLRDGFDLAGEVLGQVVEADVVAGDRGGAVDLDDAGVVLLAQAGLRAEVLELLGFDADVEAGAVAELLLAGEGVEGVARVPVQATARDLVLV